MSIAKLCASRVESEEENLFSTQCCLPHSMFSLDPLTISRIGASYGKVSLSPLSFCIFYDDTNLTHVN